MKKIIAVVFGCIFPIIAFSQNVGQHGDTVINFTDINGNKQGKWVKRYDNGIVRYKGFFIDDRPVDTFYRYHPDGSLKARQIFEENGSSQVKIYWENGRLAAKGSFNAKEEKIGNWLYFFPEGGVSSELSYKNGDIDGKKIQYLRNGQVLTESTYEDDIKNGKYIFYFHNGNKRLLGFYKDGHRHGEFIYYLPDGTIDERGIYKNNMREEEWKEFNDKTGKYETVMYHHDVREDKDAIDSVFNKKLEYSEEHQDEIKDPEDYMKNPIQFFLDH